MGGRETAIREAESGRKGYGGGGERQVGSFLLLTVAVSVTAEFGATGGPVDTQSTLPDR